eukprot:CAMPEP_0115249218 /NCGR_PEP_ID=MMETSP0270-20121206/42477_1 /TAXON_ID=71861 /ORGANISM="Scrippsiella trochoidea, Strain CCMP3099" /LENGTH=399 /DNA_ID=CAMNT_0002664553 /DNA_START=7 /DNA_END=1203 /DNA_ORIENTATION=+
MSRSCVAGWRDTARDLEKKRREAVDNLLSMTKHTRASVLLAVREMVKESMVHDPDMSAAQKEGIKKNVDLMWEDVVVFMEFKTQASVKGSRASDDYEANAKIGTPPMRWGPSWCRAQLLYCFHPFDRSMYGKMKDRMFFVLLAISFVPFCGVRLAFFSLLLVLHMTGMPPDTYQLMNFILTMKGTQFKSGGVILLVYAVVQYVMCVKPGDPTACTEDGPGYNIAVWLSFLDMIGSCSLSWIAFTLLPCTRPHEGQDRHSLMPKLEDVEVALLTLTGSQQGQAADAPPLPGLPLVARLVDVAGWKVMMRHVGTEPPSDWALYHEYFGTIQARTAVFKARVMYNLLAMPFMFLMAPGLGTIVSLTRQTGYNRQGHCVPYTLRPAAPKPWRACDRPATATTA